VRFEDCMMFGFWLENAGTTFYLFWQHSILDRVLFR
jgi:hypothetical protein